VARRRIKVRHRRKADKTQFALEYYQLPFQMLHRQLGQSNELVGPHPVRASYWTVVPAGRYPPDQGRKLLSQYCKVVERYLGEEISQHSVAYWLHAYRRIAPRPAGENDDPATTTIVRGTVDAAIQKYGKLSPCDGVGFSNEVADHEIVDGLLMSPELNEYRKGLRAAPQLVLTKFGLEQIKQLYLCEKLAYEMWRSGAALRILGKGASLVVDHSTQAYFFDDRSAELDQLVSSYDKRQGIFAASATGTAFEHDPKNWPTAVVLPSFNVERKGGAAVQRLLRRFGAAFASPGETNFVWMPFNLKAFYDAHEPFAPSFLVAKGIPLLDVFAVLVAFTLVQIRF
jgi:hypothetical protein